MHTLPDSRWAISIGWALLHFLWQGVLVALVLAMLQRVLRRSEIRYLLSCGALLLCLLLPCGTVVHQLQPQANIEMIDFKVEPRAAFIAAVPEPGSASFLQRIEAAIRPRLPLMVTLWGLGCALMALRMGSGWALAHRWRRNGGMPPGLWIKKVKDLTGLMRIRKRVFLLASDQVDSPLTLGLWRPVILVPASLFTGMAPELLEALLAHELAHIRRHDYLVNLFQSFVEVLLFYHPAVWWISRRIRIERELLADDLAAKVLGEPRRLALALNALDDLQPHLPTPALAARGGHLMNRIHRLLRPTQDPRKTCTPAFWLAPALLAAALLTPLAATVIQETRNNAQKIFAPAALVQQIDALAKQEGIDPNLLRAVAWAESHFNPEAVSSIGAKGILQVMPETARKFGAKDLDDPDQVAAAGAHYLKTLLDRYQGDWFKAVSAYNAGETGFETGKLRPETPAYVERVLKLAKTQAVQPDLNPPSIPKGLPVPGAKTTMDFGKHKLPGDHRLADDFHNGIDLKSKEGTPVHATADGTVLTAGPQGGFGITVVLQHGEGIETLYAHLAEARVKEGQRVTAGTVIGTVGRTGKTTGPHVHYEIRKNGQPVDPSSEAFSSRSGNISLPNSPSGKESSASGELRRNDDGDLVLRMKIRCINGLKVEITQNGETKPLGEINIGNKDMIEKNPKEYTPMITFKDEKPGKPLHIRCVEDGGKGRWGEAVVNTSDFPVRFKMTLDHEPRKN